MANDPRARPRCWHVYVHKLRAWITTASASTALERLEAKPKRPYLILVVEPDGGTFLSHVRAEGYRGNVYEDEPSSEDVAAFIRKCVERPRALNATLQGKTFREGGLAPRTIRVACGGTARALRGEPEAWATFDGCRYVAECRELLKREIPEIESVSFAPVPEELIARVIRERVEPKIAEDARGGVEEEWGTRHLPGLSTSVDGFTMAFGRSLFEAAKAFAECDIDRAIERLRPVKVSYRLKLRDDVAMRLTAFVAFEGSMEEEDFGFVVHKTLTQSQAAFEVSKGNVDVESGPQMGQTCAFASAHETPFEDLDDGEAGSWPLVEREGEIDNVLWPLFFKVNVVDDGENLEISSPAIIELQAFEVSMKAIASIRASGDASFASSGDDVRAAKGPWTCTVTSFAAKGEEESIEVEIELPELPEMHPVEYLDG